MLYYSQSDTEIGGTVAFTNMSLILVNKCVKKLGLMFLVRILLQYMRLRADYKYNIHSRHIIYFLLLAHLSTWVETCLCRRLYTPFNKNVNKNVMDRYSVF